jgi:NADH:ubiquinone oxidoreductase subunit K
MFLQFLLTMAITCLSLFLIYSPVTTHFLSSTSEIELPKLDFILSVTANTTEPLWSSFTLESLRIFIFIACFLTMLSLIGEHGEKRILAFLVLVEVLLVSLATLLVLTGASANINVSAHYNAALCILAAGGADTALALAIFMTYFKVCGKITLK